MAADCLVKPGQLKVWMYRPWPRACSWASSGPDHRHRIGGTQLAWTDQEGRIHGHLQENEHQRHGGHTHHTGTNVSNRDIHRTKAEKGKGHDMKIFQYRKRCGVSDNASCAASCLNYEKGWRRVTLPPTNTYSCIEWISWHELNARGV